MRKDESLRWTKSQAALEFGIDPKTLAGRIRRGGIEPGKDDKYSTKQICTAVFGDIDGERLRLIKEQADRVEWENRINRKEYVNAAELKTVIERGLAAMVAAVSSAANLESEDKGKIIRHLRSVGESVVRFTQNSDRTTDVPGQ